MKPGDANLAATRGQPLTLSFEFYSDKARTLPYDLASGTPLLHVGTATYGTADDTLLLSTVDPHQGTAENRATATLDKTITGAILDDHIHYYFELVDVGVPVHGNIYLENP